MAEKKYPSIRTPINEEMEREELSQTTEAEQASSALSESSAEESNRSPALQRTMKLLLERIDAGKNAVGLTAALNKIGAEPSKNSEQKKPVRSKKADSARLSA